MVTGEGRTVIAMYLETIVDWQLQDCLGLADETEQIWNSTVEDHATTFSFPPDIPTRVLKDRAVYLHSSNWFRGTN